jgi:hypothetical protein
VGFWTGLEAWEPSDIEVSDSVRGHPAFLAWCIADEPEDRQAALKLFVEARRFIRLVDLRHTVSIAFCNHYRAVDCLGSMGSVMAVW